MASWGDSLRGLFGGKRAQTRKSAPKPVQKRTSVDTNSRSELLKQAMDAYKLQRKQGRDALNAALNRLQKRAPSTVDPGQLEDLMALYRAHVDLKALLMHRDKRYLVLTGIRQLLGQDGPPAPAPAPKAPAGGRRTVSRG